MDAHWPTEDGDGALGRREYPLKDFEQRGLASAILSHQGMNRAAIDREIDAPEDIESAERLLDSGHLDRGSTLGHHAGLHIEEIETVSSCPATSWQP